jgi:hypothetical protein
MEILGIFVLIGTVIFLFDKYDKAAQRNSAPPPNIPTSIYGAPARHISVTRSRNGTNSHDSFSVDYDTENRITPYELAAYKMIEAGFVPAQLPRPEEWMESLPHSQYQQYQRPTPRQYQRRPSALSPSDPYGRTPPYGGY